MSRSLKWLVAIAVGACIFAGSWRICEAVFHRATADAIGIAAVATALIFGPLAWWAGLESRAKRDDAAEGISIKVPTGEAGKTVAIIVNPDSAKGRTAHPTTSPAVAPTTTPTRPATSPAIEAVLLLRSCWRQAIAANYVFDTIGVRDRRLDLVEGHLDQLLELLQTGSVELATMTSPAVVAASRNYIQTVLPEYCHTYRLLLRLLRTDVDEDEQENRQRKAAKYALSQGWDELERAFKCNSELARVLADPKIAKEDWRLLGFASQNDLDEYLQPTMATLPQPLDDRTREVFEILLSDPIKPDDLIKKGIPATDAEVLINRLLIDGWARMEDGMITITEIGRSLLTKQLAK